MTEHVRLVKRDQEAIYGSTFMLLICKNTDVACREGQNQQTYQTRVRIGD
jgi:hypothetical protein